jgi:hypothetical protein
MVSRLRGNDGTPRHQTIRRCEERSDEAIQNK